MKKQLRLFARMAALPMAVLLAVPTMAAQTKDVKPVLVSVSDFNGFRPWNFVGLRGVQLGQRGESAKVCLRKQP